jgi:hypothetical protein
VGGCVSFVLDIDANIGVPQNDPGEEALGWAGPEQEPATGVFMNILNGKGLDNDPIQRVLSLDSLLSRDTGGRPMG